MRCGHAFDPVLRTKFLLGDTEACFPALAIRDRGDVQLGSSSSSLRPYLGDDTAVIALQAASLGPAPGSNP